jgi:hypothetical protein
MARHPPSSFCVHIPCEQASSRLITIIEIYRADAALGPATRWLVDRLRSETSDVVELAPRAPRLAAV